MRAPDFFMDKYAPVTSGFSIVGARLDEVVDHWLAWQREGWEVNGFKMPVLHMDGSLAAKLDALLPLDSRARLMTETRDGRIAIFANFCQGDGSSDAPYLARYFERDNLRVVLSERRKYDGKAVLNTLPSIQFDWAGYGIKSDHWLGYKTRSIAAHMENRWEWHEHGEPFPWEETEAYTAKRIKDRLTPEMVERYAKHMGIDLFDPDYYSGRAVIVRIAPLPAADDPAMALISHYPNQ
jgi:hypothetical protein